MKRYILLFSVLAFIIVLAISGTTFAGTTIRISVDSNGVEGNDDSDGPAISTDGKYIAFNSVASNFDSNDTNSEWDVFIHDTLSGITELVSTDSIGQIGNGYSEIPALSDDLRYVAFDSVASNLVPGDTNGRMDCFVKDRLTDITERVSVDSNGQQGNYHSTDCSISGDGRYVAFYSSSDNLIPNDTNGTSDVFVHDRETGVTERVSVDSNGQEANSSSYHTKISNDGRYVVFSSAASNLVLGDTNIVMDIFVKDRVTGLTERVSVDSNGQEANAQSYAISISSNGRYVAFDSVASNLVPGDNNGTQDVFVHDRETGVTERVSVDSNGQEANSNSRIEAIPYESISGDGRYVAFLSTANNLVAGDTNGVQDIFVHDRVSGITERVNVSSSGQEANGYSSNFSISADGRYVAFDSDASNLVPDDTNGAQDAFVHYLDNDGDGFTRFDDCNDDDLSIYPGAPEICKDRIDNDCDGLADRKDPEGCITCDDTETICTDGNDNDCDGLVDVDDPDCECTVTEPTEVTCDDGIDNDCDYLTDGNDPDCPTGTCADYTNEIDCNNDTNCSWSTKKGGSCKEITGGTSCSDYTDQATCEANSCSWNSKKQTCR